MVDKLNVIKISQTGNWKKINVMWITLAIHPLPMAKAQYEAEMMPSEPVVFI